MQDKSVRPVQFLFAAIVFRVHVASRTAVGHTFILAVCRTGHLCSIIMFSRLVFKDRSCRLVMATHVRSVVFNPITALAYTVSGEKISACMHLKQYILRSYSTFTFNAVRFGENPFKCSCEKEAEKGFKFGTFWGHF